MGRRQFFSPFNQSNKTSALYTPKRPRLLNVADDIAYYRTEDWTYQDLENRSTNDWNISQVLPEDDVSSVLDPPPVNHGSSDSVLSESSNRNSIVGDYYEDNSEEDSLPSRTDIMCPASQTDSSSSIFGDEIQMGIELLQLCHQAHVPLKCYDQILRLYKKYSGRGIMFSKVPSRERLMAHLKSKLPFTEPQISTNDSTDDIVPKLPYPGVSLLS